MAAARGRGPVGVRHSGVHAAAELAVVQSVVRRRRRSRRAAGAPAASYQSYRLAAAALHSIRLDQWQLTAAGPRAFSRRKWATSPSPTADGCAWRWPSPTPTSWGCPTSASRPSTRCFNAEPGIVCERVFLPPKSEIAALRAAGTPIVTLESQTPVREFDVLAFSVSFEWDYTNVLTMMSLAGVPQRAADRTRARSAGHDRRRRHLREPRAAGAVRRRHRRGRGRGAGSAARARRSRRRTTATSCCTCWPRSAATTCRRSTTCATRPTAPSTRSRRSRAPGAPPVVRKAALKTTEAADPPATADLHARHRVRLAVPGGGGARLRQPVPVLLGRLQLPARARVSRRSASCSWPRPRGAHSDRVGLVSIALCDHPDIEEILSGLVDDGLQHQPRVAAARRPDAHASCGCCARAASAASRSRLRPAPTACAA